MCRTGERHPPPRIIARIRSHLDPVHGGGGGGAPAKGGGLGGEVGPDTALGDGQARQKLGVGDHVLVKRVRKRQEREAGGWGVGGGGGGGGIKNVEASLKNSI